MSTETRRQAWYALAFILLPIAIWQLNSHLQWYADLPPGLRLAAGFVVALLIFVLLRFTNPWETSGPSEHPTRRVDERHSSDNGRRAPGVIPPGTS